MSSNPAPENRLKIIESLLPGALHADRHAGIIELKRVRKSLGGRRPDKKTGQRLDRLKTRLERSAQIKQNRIDGIPELDSNPDLPITQKRKEIVDLISQHQVIIVSGETGSGKTTQLPKFCLEAGRGIEGRIACTQPRRIAAITVASRIAEELGEQPGNSVGYKIRFQDRISDRTVVKMMTDGILLAEAQGDRFLNEYDTIIVDEAHERSLNIDFLLGLLKQITTRRRDLKLIITSATIDTEKFSKAFGNAPIVEVSGRMYPVETRYLPPESFLDSGDDFSHVEAAVKAVDSVVRESPFGDVLIFMPTEQDIRETCETLEGRKYKGAVILPLFARLSAADQSRVFKPAAGRKIVVATNVAETSITIPGIKYVVDTGLARISNYIPTSRTTALPVSPISKSSADQRMGRCGRVENGVCIRLYSEDDYESRPMYTPPEIHRANLAEVILRMVSLNLGDVDDFPFVDPPPARQIKEGFNILFELDAIENTGLRGKKSKGRIRLTKKGELMAKLPLDPRLSRMLIEARENGVLPEVTVIAAALTTIDPRERPEDKEAQADQAHAVFKDPASDFITRYNIWRTLHGDPDGSRSVIRAKQLKQFVNTHMLSFKRMREWIDIHDQIASLLEESGMPVEGSIPNAKLDATLAATQNGGKNPDKPIKKEAPDKKDSEKKDRDRTGFSALYAAVHKSILSGFLANIAEQKEKNFYRAAKQREVMLFPGSALFNKGGRWIVAAEIVETSRRFARMAANIDSAWLEPLAGNQCKYTYSNPRWQRKRESVVANEQVSLYGLIIVPARPVQYGRIDPDAASEIFIREALVEGDVKTELPFMEHNRELAEEIRDMENRVRRRGLLISDADMQQFYENRLEKVYDMRTLKRMIREKGSDDFLRMKPEDLMAGNPDENELTLYPDSLPLGGTEYSCTYRFNPGEGDDGVTITLPASAAGSIPRETTDWVVPGFLSEKIAGLIKNLPKNYRKQLVPVNDTVAIIMDEMPKYQGSLVATLSRFINDRFNVDIPVSAFTEEVLPEHLKLRFSLVDPQGKEMVAGRDRQVLNGPEEASLEPGSLKREKKKWEKSGITRWDFGDLPETVTVDAGSGQSWPVYPGLEADNDKSVRLRLYMDSRKAKEGHRAGVARLFSIYFSKELKHLEKTVVLSGNHRAAAVAFGGTKAVESAIINRVIHQLFARDIRTETDFYDHAQKMVNRMIPEALAIKEQVLPVLSAHHELRARLSDMAKTFSKVPGGTSFLDQLQASLTRLVPENFIALYSSDRMPHLVRYIHALQRRAERGINAPDKDQTKAAQVNRFEKLLEDLIASLDDTSSTDKREAIEQFYWMIEELKVSLFAQELKTAFPVSEKRLEKKYKEVLRMV